MSRVTRIMRFLLCTLLCCGLLSWMIDIGAEARMPIPSREIALQALDVDDLAYHAILAQELSWGERRGADISDLNALVPDHPFGVFAPTIEIMAVPPVPLAAGGALSWDCARNNGPPAV